MALGGGFFVALIVAAKLIDNITAASLAFSHTYRIDPQEARLTAGLAYWMQRASMAGASLLLGGARVWRWGAVCGYVLAAAAPVAAGLNGVPVLVFFVWILGAGLMLARGSTTSGSFASPGEERSAAHG